MGGGGGGGGGGAQNAGVLVGATFRDVYNMGLEGQFLGPKIKKKNSSLWSDIFLRI